MLLLILSLKMGGALLSSRWIWRGWRRDAEPWWSVWWPSRNSLWKSESQHMIMMMMRMMGKTMMAVMSKKHAKWNSKPSHLQQQKVDEFKRHTKGKPLIPNWLTFEIMFNKESVIGSIGSWIIPKEASMSRTWGLIYQKYGDCTMIAWWVWWHPLFSAWLTTDNAHICNIEWIVLRDVWNLMKKYFLSASDDFHRTIRQQRWSKSHPYSLIGQIHLWEFVR